MMPSDRSDLIAKDWPISKEFWIAARHALLILVGAIERELGVNPTTKECRDREKAHRKES